MLESPRLARGPSFLPSDFLLILFRSVTDSPELQHVAGQPRDDRHDAQAQERREITQPQRPGDQHRGPLRRGAGRSPPHLRAIAWPTRQPLVPARRPRTPTAAPGAAAPRRGCPGAVWTTRRARGPAAAGDSTMPWPDPPPAQADPRPGQHSRQVRRCGQRRRRRGRRHRHPGAQARSEHLQRRRGGQTDRRHGTRWWRVRVGAGCRARIRTRSVSRRATPRRPTAWQRRSCQHPRGDPVRPQQTATQASSTPMTNSHPPIPPDSRKLTGSAPMSWPRPTPSAGRPASTAAVVRAPAMPAVDARRESFPLNDVPLRGLHQRGDRQAVRLGELPAHREPLPVRRQG